MITITARSNSAAAAAALRTMPDLIQRYMGPAIDRAAMEVEREAKRNASRLDSFGFNRSSIHIEKTGPLRRVVATGTKYSAYVEEGVKGPLPKMPDVSGLMPWVRQNLPGGTPQQVDRLTYVIARGIQRKGIRAQPFMAPAAEKMAPRVEQLLSDALDQALAQMMGGEL